MKTSAKRTLGMVLTAISALALAVAVVQVAPIYENHFSMLCGSVIVQAGPNARMAYCISIWPPQPDPAGGQCCAGVTDRDEINLPDLDLKREEQTLYVNGQALNTGEAYKTVHWKASLNPWLILTNRFEISNGGINAGLKPADETMNALYVSGEVAGGWLLNPLGLILLGCGLWLVRQARKEADLTPND